MAGKLRGFGWIQAALSAAIMPLGFIMWGLAAVPGIWLFREVDSSTEGVVGLLALGAAIGIGALVWCLAVLLMMGFCGLLLRPSRESQRAPTESWLTIRWAFMALFHRLALPSLKWLVPSFIGNLYYQLMGCKIGRGAQINTPAMVDAYMVEIGARTILGGDSVVNGHLFEKDGIHLAPVKIGSDVVIGTLAHISPGCVIGDGAVIAACAFLAKFTEVPAGEIWGGIPAKCIRKADGSKPEST